MTANYYYKCRLCGQLFKAAYARPEKAARELGRALEGCSALLPLTERHTCNRNACGVGDLVGYAVEDK